MPSDSELRLQHSYYRGCWHEFSRCFLRGEFNPERYSLPGITPLQQSFTTLRPSSLTRNCSITLSRISGRFSTAASRRSLGSVSVPVWPDTLSGRLAIIVLVGRYPTNKLIARGPLLKRQPKPALITRKTWGPYAVLAILSNGYPPHQGRSSTHYSPVRHSLTPKSSLVRLACLIHSVSVRSEPVSNPSVLFWHTDSLFNKPALRRDRRTPSRSIASLVVNLQISQFTELAFRS